MKSTRCKKPRSLRERAEAQVRQSPQTLPKRSDTDSAWMVHELSIHQEELTIQNEELRGTQADLETSRDRYRDLYDFAPVGYLTLDSESVIRECNLTICKMLGVSRSNLRRRKFHRFVAPASQDDFYFHQHQVFSTPHRQSCELMLHLSNGRSLIVTVESIAEKAAPDKPQASFMAVSDITARRRTQAALRESEAFSDKVLTTALNGIFVHDLKRGQTLFINPEFTALTGYTLARFNALCQPGLLAAIHPDDHPTVTAHLDAVARSKDNAVLEVEFHLRTSAGHWLPCLSRDLPFARDADGSVRSFMGAVVDATGRY